jgi:ABC-type bacteriocin/lantibiotic exporter with double-glycine peptidase domain
VSGGQKQRISLARAAYSPSSIVLLDDPLSAVDAPTARHLLLNCILGPLMNGRTVILVSHAVGLVLPRADYVVVVKNGSISAKVINKINPRELHTISFRVQV